jgi:hypothetical protein
MAKVNKFKSIEKLLVDRGYITNVECLNGSLGFRTNRLGAVICILRTKYVIDTEIKRFPSGDYEDCIYRYRRVK